MKATRIVFTAILSLLTIALLATKFDYDNSKAFEYVITFLSILAGFNVTALSIVANSQFSARLYNKEAPDDNSKTLLHVLVNEFKQSTGIFLLTIALILVFFFIMGDTSKDAASIDINGIALTIPRVLKAVIWYLVIVSSLKFQRLLAMFSKFVTQSAPKNL